MPLVLQPMAQTRRCLAATGRCHANIGGILSGKADPCGTAEATEL
jgi:hypothetical protein